MRPTEKFDLYALGAAAAGLAVFLFIISKKVFVSGLCCGDDAAMAIVAKNVAWGYGYATSFHHTGAPGLFLFDYGISTGPALILPAAALIGVVGNTSWAPGLTTAVVVGVALLLVWITQVRRTGALPGSVFLLSFLLLCFAFTTRHFEHWHALLGEMPAGLLVVAAGLLIGGNPDDRRTAGFAGLLLALAVLTKLLAALAALAMIVWFVDRAARRRDAAPILAAALGFLLPIAAFEMWKLFVLGGSGFVRSWMELLRFSGVQGASGAFPLVANAQAFANRFGLPFHAIVLSELAAMTIIWWRGDEQARRLGGLFFAASAIHFTWWLAISPGWPRYALLGLIYHAALLACMASVARGRRIGVLATVLIGLQITQPFAMWDITRDAITKGFRPSAGHEAMLATASFLATQGEGKLLVSGWWATAADLEYLSPRVGSIVQSNHAQASEEPTWLVRNTLFLRAYPTNVTSDYLEWEQRCSEPLFNRGTHVVTACPAAR